MKLTILHEDDDLIFVDKPAGLLAIPDRFDSTLPSVKGLLEQKTGDKIFIVHRIDRETSGCMVFAKNEEAHRHLSIQFQEHIAGKFYVGLVHGRLAEEAGTIDVALIEHPAQPGKMTVAKKGKASRTDYRVVEQWPLHALVQFRIFTGRMHQIRVHMQSIGHPLLCDPLYGDGKPFFLSSVKRKFQLSKHDEVERPLLSRVALHSYRLVVESLQGEEISVEAPLPKDLNAVVQQLRKVSGSV
ncbi:MAG: RluA family pseudouridine synthase [Sphingobacteriales bacterium]|nr:MAG: RluA family pseudouridine synthase [Sphingobacteriales bacterium]